MPADDNSVTYAVAGPVLGPLPLPTRTDLHHRMHALAVKFGLSVQIHHVEPEYVRRLSTAHPKVEPCPVAVFEGRSLAVRPGPHVELDIDMVSVMAVAFVDRQRV